MRRWPVWTVLTAAAGLLAGSAIARPMSNLDYATSVQIEVDFQNITCSDIEYLQLAFNELVGRCPPFHPDDPPVYTPPRVCPDRLPPTYRLSPDMYATLGPGMRGYLASAGAPWDMDADDAELRGRLRSSSQFFVAAPINALARELDTAARLKNCRPL